MLPQLSSLGLYLVVQFLDAQQRLDTSDQGGLLDGFCQIVVTTRLQTGHDVPGVRLRRDQYHWNKTKLIILLQLFDYRNAVQLRHHHIE